MERIEKSINIESIFTGKVIRVERHHVALLEPNEEKSSLETETTPYYSIREIVRHPGGVCVVAINAEREVCFVKQYRKAVEATIWEVPAGKCEPGEDPLLTAQRELKEETGYQAQTWEFLGEMYATPGYCDEKIFMYLATDLEVGEQALDDGEFLSVHWLAWEKIQEEVTENRLLDGKTKLAFLLAKEKLQHKTGI